MKKNVVVVKQQIGLYETKTLFSRLWFNIKSK